MITQTCHTIRSQSFSSIYLSGLLLYRTRRSAVRADRYPLMSLSDTNEVWIVDGREVMDMEDLGVSRPEALRQKPAGRRRRHRWTDTMRPSTAWTALIFLLIQGASRACTGTAACFTPNYGVLSVWLLTWTLKARTNSLYSLQQSMSLTQMLNSEQYSGKHFENIV